MVKETLYKRIGGYDSIAVLSGELIKALESDKIIGRFFVGQSEDSKRRQKQLLAEFICGTIGGPCEYIGRDIKTTHTGLHITEEDWDITVKILSDILDKLSINMEEKGEVLCAISEFKKDITGL